MKDFLKYTLATMTGIVILSVIMAIISVISIVGMIASSSSTTPVEDNSVFVLSMKGVVSERSGAENPLMTYFGGDMEEMGLDDIIQSIRKAKDNDDIKGIYIEADAVAFDSYATAQTLRDELEKFKKSGKWIVAYGDNYMQMSYYVASVADKVYLNKTGMIDFRGLGGVREYDKGLAEKLGVKFQVLRVGKYKSAVEGYLRNDMSPEDREQRMAYLSGVWQKMLHDIAQSRKVTAQALDNLASDSIIALADPADYVKAKLVDKLMYPEEIKQEIKNRLKLDADEAVAQLTLADMLNVKADESHDGDKVAVYYAVGEIIDAKASGFSTGENIVGSTMAQDLRELADDDDVKAVVIRVNSPGGSAVASEQIWHAVKTLKARKPVVVSMGGVAASGGYMISAAANTIFAEPTTITGSIGIFGVVPNFSGLVTDKLGITFDGASTNKYTNYDHNIALGKENSEELRYMQAYVDRGYVSFLDIVADGRKMKRDEVNEIAQGRVWLATDALRIKLIDKLGSLDDAVAEAAKLAKLKEYYPSTYPEKSDWMDALIPSKDKGSYLDAELRSLLGDLYEPVVELRLNQQRNPLQARLPFSTRVK